MTYVKSFILIGLLLHFGNTFGQSIERKVVSSGGSTQSSGGIQLSSTIGESIVTTSKKATLTITQGFQQSYKKKEVIDPADTTNIIEHSINSLVLFPNPTHNEVRIKSSIKESFDLIVVDGLGKQLHSEIIQLDNNSEHRISVEDWAIGTYYFKLVSKTDDAFYDYVVIKD